MGDSGGRGMAGPNGLGGLFQPQYLYDSIFTFCEEVVENTGHYVNFMNVIGNGSFGLGRNHRNHILLITFL